MKTIKILTLNSFKISNIKNNKKDHMMKNKKIIMDLLISLPLTNSFWLSMNKVSMLLDQEEIKWPKLLNLYPLQLLNLLFSPKKELVEELKILVTLLKVSAGKLSPWILIIGLSVLTHLLWKITGWKLLNKLKKPKLISKNPKKNLKVL